MLIDSVDLKLHGTPLDPLEAYDPELQARRQRFSGARRRPTSVFDAADRAESASGLIYSKVPLSERGHSAFFGLLPNVRCSL